MQGKKEKQGPGEEKMITEVRPRIFDGAGRDMLEPQQPPPPKPRVPAWAYDLGRIEGQTIPIGGHLWRLDSFGPRGIYLTYAGPTGKTRKSRDVLLRKATKGYEKRQRTGAE